MPTETDAAAAGVLWMVVPGDQLTRPATERPSETVAVAPPAAGPSMSAPAPAPAETAPPPPQLPGGRVELDAAQLRRERAAAEAPPAATPPARGDSYDSVRGFGRQETSAPTVPPAAAPVAADETAAPEPTPERPKPVPSTQVYADDELDVPDFLK